METFYSWVPTLAGRLSFSAANPLEVGKTYVQLSDLTSGGRTFVAAVEWLNSDMTIPFLSSGRAMRARLERLLTGNDTRFIFLVVFKVSSDFEYMRGTANIVSGRLWDMHRDELQSWLSRAYERLRDHSEEAEEDFLSGMTSIGNVSYMLRRNGAIEIAPTSIDTGVVKSLTKNYSSPAESISYFVFHFLRAIFHTHRYHSLDSDTIISVYEDSTNWRSKVCASLMRKIVVLRKLGDSKNILNAQGILAYLDTFAKFGELSG